MRPIRKLKGGRMGMFFSLLADTSLLLLTLFMVLTMWFVFQWKDSEQIAKQVPGLRRTVKGQGATIAGQTTKIKGQSTTIRGQKRTIAAQGKKMGGQAATINGQHHTIIIQGKRLTGQGYTIAKQGEEIAERGKKIVRQGLTISELADKVSQIRSGHPITVFIIIDVTKSMGEAISELQSSMAALCEFMATTSQDFRVGCVAMRNGVVAEFPVTQILPTYEDGGQSQQSVLAFLNSLKAEHAYTNHLAAFKTAFSLLAQAHTTVDPERRTRVILLGDIGPSELDEKPGYNTAERAMKMRLLKGVTKWASKGNRGMESFYAESSYTAKDPSRAESKAWFKALGSVSPHSNFYSDTNNLLRAIRQASQED